MKLVHRLAYYGVGLFFGIIILIFFLGGKRASCDYGPEDRVLKNIRIKKRQFSPEALSFFQKNQLDTAKISSILNEGDVDFSRSNTDAKPCNLYMITANAEEKPLELIIQNCDSLATIQKVSLIK